MARFAKLLIILYYLLYLLSVYCHKLVSKKYLSASLNVIFSPKLKVPGGQGQFLFLSFPGTQNSARHTIDALS